ncbi:MAG: hypothetical protein ACLUVC_00065 [Longibaculum sp.]
MGEEVKEKKDVKKTCFIITPIGSEGSEIRREIEGIIDEVINPVLEEMGYETNNVAHRKDSTSSIPSDVIKSVYEADLCIANLTGNNANVMYELALRHAAGKHVIIITDNISSLPFDINVQRAIEYKNDMQGALELKKELISKIEYINEHPDEISNPIYDNLQKIVIKDSDVPDVSVDFNDTIKLLLNETKSIRSDIEQLKYKNSQNSNHTLDYDSIEAIQRIVSEFENKFFVNKSQKNIEGVIDLISKSSKYCIAINELIDDIHNIKERNILISEKAKLKSLINQMNSYIISD